MIHLLLFGALLGCGETGEKTSSYAGTIEVTEVDVASLLPGRLSELTVDRGAAVKKGERLFTLETEKAAMEADLRRAGVAQALAAIDTARAQLRAADAQVKTLKKELRRTVALVDRGAATDQQLNQVSGQLAVAQAQSAALREAIAQAEAVKGQAESGLALAQYQVEQSSTISPLDGVVLSRNREPGEVVAAGMSVVTIGDLAHPRLRIYVPLLAMERIAVGTAAEVRLDAFPDQVYAGRVEWISSEAEFTPREILTPEERVKQVFAVEIALEPARGLNPGVPAEATFPSVEGA